MSVLVVGKMPGLTGSGHLIVQCVGLEHTDLEHYGLGLMDQRLEHIRLAGLGGTENEAPGRPHCPKN